MDSYLVATVRIRISMFERTQLLERFGLLERGLWQRRKREQEVASKAVETDVLVDHGPGCRTTSPPLSVDRAITHETESATAKSRAHRRGCPRRPSPRAGSRSRKDCSSPGAASTSDRRVGHQRLEHLRDHAWLDERQVALHVDEDVARQISGDLRNPVRARSDASSLSVGRFHRTFPRLQQSARRRSRRRRRRCRAHRRRDDRRARSSGGRRCQRAAFQEVSKRRIGRG